MEFFRFCDMFYPARPPQTTPLDPLETSPLAIPANWYVTKPGNANRGGRIFLVLWPLSHKFWKYPSQNVGKRLSLKNRIKLRICLFNCRYP